MRLNLTSVLFLVLGLISVTPAGAAEWKAGLASVKITPEEPVLLAGYASRVKPFEKVEQDLFAKALALEDREGTRAVIVTTDLLGLSAAVAEPVFEQIYTKTRLPRGNILLSAAHNHAAPILSLKAQPPTGASLEDAEKNVAYTKRLQQKLAALVEQALAKLEPAELAWGAGVAHFAMNRREFTTNGVILGVNPRGPADRTVPVLRVNGADGKTRALLFGYACHNTTLTQTNYAVAGDYAGFTQAYIEQHLPGVQAMYIAGLGGDANPYPRGTMEIARQHGNTLGEEVCRVATTRLRAVNGPLRCVSENVNLPLQQLARAEIEKRASSGQSWQAPQAKQMLSLLDRGESLARQYTTSVSVWQFGSEITLVALPGEVVVDYAALIERAIGPLNLWLAAYCNDVFGYLPSARVLKEGGYETRGLYTALGWFDASAEHVLVRKVSKIAQKAGRRIPER